MTIKSGTDKCPYCDGKGYYYQESSYGMELIQCSCQNKQTNEEWFCQLSTEDKADFLADLYPKSAGEALIKISNGDKERWAKWLKERHDGSV